MSEKTSMVRPNHQPRSDPYPDELDQQFCTEDQTLCQPGRPCLCCLVDQLDAADGRS
jgi:hypothetical protein